ncbi:MAG: lipopolysaccharide biosynthesis protein [Flavobacteriales bacterium]|jgi:lipopolysaccharide exporter
MTEQKRTFMQNVMVLFTGTAVSQLIPFLVLPILQKYYYGPEDFAKLASFVYFSEMFGVISTLKLEYAIVGKPSLRDSREVAITGFRVVTVGAVLVLILAAINYRFDWIHGLHELGAVIFLMPFVVFAMGCVQLTAYWFNARKEYDRIARGKLIQTASGEGVKLLSGFSGLNFSGLIIGRVSGYSLTAIFQYFRYRKDVADVERRNFSKWKLLGDHKSFIFYTTPSVFVGAFINFLSIEMFVENFGPASAGMMSVAMTYVGAGLGMVAASISQVYYGTISGIHEKKAMLSLYAKFLGRLTVMSAVMTALVWVLPASWVVGVLGEEWNDLIVYCRVISLWLGVWFVSSSLSFIYLRLQRQREMLVFDVLHIVLVYAGFHAGKVWGGDALSALWGFTWAQIISYVMAIALAIRFIQVSKSLR